MPLEMICGTISREFHEFASKNYVTECLDSKYKDMTQSHPTTRTKAKENLKVEVGNVRLPNNGKNVTEQKGEAEEQQREFEIIRPEDYIIEDLRKYSSQLKDRIIIYLDEELKKLTKEVQSRNN